MGIIDENGKQLIKSRDFKTSKEKEAYSKFHMLVFNLKKLMEKVPLGKTTIARYAGALWLIKEHTLEHNLKNGNIIMETFKKHILDEDCTTVTSGIDGVDGVIGRKKKNDEFEEIEEFAGNKVFRVDNASFDKSRLGKTRYCRFKTFVGEDETGEKIRKYGRNNPGKGIILKNKENPSMIWLRHPTKRNRK